MKKRILILSVVLALVLAAVLYFTLPCRLTSLWDGEPWQSLYACQWQGSFDIDFEADLSAVQSLLEETTVRRWFPSDVPDNPSVQLIVRTTGGRNLYLLIGSAGRIFTAYMDDLDHTYQYWRCGGSELYEKICDLGNLQY